MRGESVHCWPSPAQIILSTLWLRYFRFGLLEWLWRMLTYGRYFPLR